MVPLTGCYILYIVSQGGHLLQTACGSPCYAAPEMIAGKHYVGPMVRSQPLSLVL